MSLCRGTTRSCIWRLGKTLTYRPHVLKLSLTLCYFLLGHPTTQRRNKHPIYSQVTQKHSFALDLCFQCPLLVVSISILLILCPLSET